MSEWNLVNKSPRASQGLKCGDEGALKAHSVLDSESSVKTPGDVLRSLRENGVSIAEWSAQNGFKAKLVYAVLQGGRKCLRGQSHLIALRLGLKVQNAIDTSQH